MKSDNNNFTSSNETTKEYFKRMNSDKDMLSNEKNLSTMQRENSAPSLENSYQKPLNSVEESQKILNQNDIIISVENTSDAESRLMGSLSHIEDADDEENSDIERQDSDQCSADSKESLLELPRTCHRLTFTQEIAAQIRKGVTFTTNVVGETVGVNELIGIPDAPQMPNAVLDLVTVAEKVRKDQKHPSDHYDGETKQKKTLRLSLSRPDLVYPFLKSDRMKEFCDSGIFESGKQLESIPRSLSSPLDQLKIMSFNVGLLEYRLAGITWYCNPPFTKRRLQHLALALREVDCDIIALQEVYQEWQSDYLLEALRIKFPFVGRRSSGSFISLHNGLLTLSRFPIIKTAYYPFKSVTFIERVFGSKGLLETTVDIPTVGQASGAVDPESSSLEALRNEEIEEVFKICDEAVERGEIPLIIGDLNAAPNVCPSNYRNFCQRGFQDAFLAAKKGEKNSDPLKEVQELDKVWKDCRNLKINPQCKKRLRSKLHRNKKPPCFQRKSTRIRKMFRRKFHSEDNLQHVKSRPEIRVSSDNVLYDSDRNKPKYMTRLKFNKNKKSPKNENASSCLSTMSLKDDNNIGDNTFRQKFANKFSSYSFNELTHKASQFFNSAIRQSTYKNLSKKGDPFCTMFFTWDPKNPLNVVGPHADCHGIRCDHLFLPPKNIAKGLKQFEPVRADILFDEPLVAVRSSWCGLSGTISLLTLSDHYAIRIVLQRS